MRIPSSFKTDVADAYAGKLSLDELIRRQESFLRGLARFALRHRTQWYLSDEDDMFQEACMWLVQCMWDWDEVRGTPLERYLAYNIGVRLGTQAKKECKKRRHPKNGFKVDIWDTRGKNGDCFTWEESIPSADNTETAVAIRRAIARAEQELTQLAQLLLSALIENSGNFSGAVRDLLLNDDIRRRYGSDRDHLKYVLRRKVLPEIFSFLGPTHIIPANAMSNR